MSLTSADETDLLLPLHETALGDERFPGFLRRLRDRTRAAHVGLVLRSGEAPELRFSAGLDLVGEARRRGLPETAVTARFPLERLRPARVYALDEFVADSPRRRATWDAALGAMGLVDERIVRIAAAEQLDGWLVIARAEPCTAGDSALLSALVPHLAVALRAHAASERERMALAIARSGLAHTATGWIAFDREARITALDPATGWWLEQASGHRPRAGERLQGLEPAVDRQLITTAAALAEGQEDAGRGLCLSAAPRIDAVLTRSDDAAMVALCRFAHAPDKPTSRLRAQRLAELHGIARREAELAVLMSEGHSIAEAATEMGLTLETARNYSKQLYAKLGIRGQAELVRLVCESGAVLG